MFKRCSTIVAIATSLAMLSACSGQPAAAPTTAPAPSAPSPAARATPAPLPTIPAPTVAAPTVAATTAAPTTAASAAAAPHFAHPTDFTNPYYPVSQIGQSIELGQEEGKPSRNEVYLLPTTKMIDIGGQQVEARILQFVAFTDRQLAEVAYDYFAQADDGSVYYLGEDVSNYEDGKVASTEGSWLAGKDGAPAALIMPAQPKVGELFNPENLPGVVFESDEILSLEKQTTTPEGPTDKGIWVKETLMDGSVEHKVYAANYGIVEEQAPDERLNLVWFNRAGVASGSVPQALSTIEAQAEDIFDVVPGGDWPRAATDVAAIGAAWNGYRAQAAQDHVPQPFQDALSQALEQLSKASKSKDAHATLQAANHLSAATVDLFTVYHPATPTELGGLDVLERQVGLDVAAKDVSAAADSLAKIAAIWARLKPVAQAHSGGDAAGQFDAALAAQTAALEQKNAAVLATTATQALELVDALEQLFG